MKTGLLFGSFNPIHIGHLIIAQYMIEFNDLEEVWLVVSPHNPLKPIGSLLQDYHRLSLVKMAIGSYGKLKASNVEFSMPKPSYTINTLENFSKKFPEKDFVLIIGSDNLETFDQWKEYQKILDNYFVYVYPRKGSDGGKLKKHKHVKCVDAPLIEISSTFIRNAIKNKKDVSYMIPQSVAEYISEMNFYAK